MKINHNKSMPIDFQLLETLLTEVCAKINALDPKNREAVSALYEVTFNLFRCCLRLEDRVDGLAKALPPAEACECECNHKKPILEIAGIVPPDIILKAMEVEMWMKRNGHFHWVLGGIQSRENG
jgi:hypothetical protein